MSTEAIPVTPEEPVDARPATTRMACEMFTLAMSNMDPERPQEAAHELASKHANLQVELGNDRCLKIPLQHIPQALYEITGLTKLCDHELQERLWNLLEQIKGQIQHRTAQGKDMIQMRYDTVEGMGF